VTRIAPVDIAFRNLSSIDWVEADIRKRAAKLASYCPDIQSCRVLVEVPHRHHRHGNRFHIRIDVTVPGEEVAVSHAPDLHGVQQDRGEMATEKGKEPDAARKDRRLVIREAFDIARRRLQDYAQRRRHAVKAHVSHPRPRRPRLIKPPVGRSG